MFPLLRRIGIAVWLPCLWLPCFWVLCAAAHAQQYTGWRPAREPMPALRSTDRGSMGSDSSSSGPVAEMARANRSVDWQRRPIDARSPVRPTVGRTRTLPFAEDEIVSQPSPDGVSLTAPGAATELPPPDNVYGAPVGPEYFSGPDASCPDCCPGGPCMTSGPCYPCGPFGGFIPMCFHHLFGAGPYNPFVVPGQCGQCNACGPCASCGGPCDDCGSCGACGGCYGCADVCGPDVMAGERFHPCSFWSALNEASIILGAQGFQGPLDSPSGNFGFHEGINLGDSIWHRKGLGYQLGINYNQSDLGGNPILGTGVRQQTFVTAGFFHRAYYGRGLQAGIVFDYLHDNYFVNSNISQLRFEVSSISASGHEIGYWGTASARESALSVTGVGTINVKPIQMNTLFYRRTLRNGSQGRVWAGVATNVFGGGTTSTTDPIFGADFRMPLSNRVDFIGGFNYVSPTQGGTANGFAQGWGLSMSLVFYPARFLNGTHNGPYRPLFNVADNNNFILDRHP